MVRFLNVSHKREQVDETGAHIAMTPLYAYAPRVQRAYGKVPRNYGANTKCEDDPFFGYRKHLRRPWSAVSNLRKNRG